jgi:uncharacterized surface protein with fasciclin (FAS1) repeats
MKDILQTMKETDLFATLFTVLDAAGLCETLSGPGPFTLFAPVEESFNKLSIEDRKDLLQSRWKQRQMLASHVLADRVTVADIENMGLAKMMNGKIVDIAVDGDGIMIDGAKIIQGDIFCSNGVIHAIDAIIQPK